jgi:hypothetical protein
LRSPGPPATNGRRELALYSRAFAEEVAESNRYYGKHLLQIFNC